MTSSRKTSNARLIRLVKLSNCAEKACRSISLGGGREYRKQDSPYEFFSREHTQLLTDRLLDPPTHRGSSQHGELRLVPLLLKYIGRFRAQTIREGRSGVRNAARMRLHAGTRSCPHPPDLYRVERQCPLSSSNIAPALLRDDALHQGNGKDANVKNKHSIINITAIDIEVAEHSA